MLHVLILAIALACVSCETHALSLNARTNEDNRPLDHSRRFVWGTIYISGGLFWGRRKRSTEGERFELVIYVNPCTFMIYDANRDDVITMDELEAIFGDGDKTKELFQALDSSGDGQVDKEEFKENMHIC